ncbi:MAG: hypothetical protein JWQ90_3472 [Hydrocarboniphaga sp.]|uniref:tetratricopeptide repeat protein n=1 Tax=Hydrocarboniphaga sp. TaxID=2033016 RepID=UPI002618E496|nr:tetratricopeptide repeat protein [Hydrocarboniphaga sp.]MDB5971022.1 hypothetical protein [Hydrocarboniphaga sp.]
MSVLSSFFKELQRRNVYKVGAMYTVAGWLIVQVVTQVFPVFHVGERIQQLIVVAIIAGFPLALVLSWIYELTPQGIVRTDEVAPDVSITRGTGQRLNQAIIGVLTLAVLLLLARLLWPHAGASGTLSDKSIAVLPFDNLSDDHANAYFATGIQDEILTRLAGIAALKVISRTSTEKYASHPDNLKLVAAELGVATLLEGSVQKSGERVRINVQLIDASSDTHLWASSYDREFKDAFAVESEVSQAIADALKAHLSPSEATALAKAPTADAAAYDLYLRAEFEFRQAQDSNVEVDYLRAGQLYRQAIALDPRFALAHARLAFCELKQHWYLVTATKAQLADIKASVDTALELGPNLPESQLALGYFHYWGYRDYDPAITAFKHVLQLSPSDSEAVSALAYVHRRKGQWPQALARLQQAIELAPRDPWLVAERAITYVLLRRYDDAELEVRHAQALDPNDINSMEYSAYIHLLGDGDTQAALHAFDAAPAERLAGQVYQGGDTLYLVAPRAYPLVVERRFDAALKLWDAVSPVTPRQRIDKLAARVVIQMLAGKPGPATSECQQLDTLLVAEIASSPEDPALLGPLSWAQLCLGHKAQALAAARRAIDLRPLSTDAYYGPYYLIGLAQIEAQAGEPEPALKLIEQLLSIPAGNVMSLTRLKHDPVWDPLRDDPRFARLIEAGAAAEKAAARS